MNTKWIAGGALAGGLVAIGAFGAVSAQSAAEATGLSEEQAIAIALAEIPGAVEEVELEREDGILVYEVEIETADGGETEVEINANSGEIIEVSVDNDDDDHDDDHDCEDKA